MLWNHVLENSKILKNTITLLGLWFTIQILISPWNISSILIWAFFLIYRIIWFFLFNLWLLLHMSLKLLKNLLLFCLMIDLVNWFIFFIFFEIGNGIILSCETHTIFIFTLWTKNLDSIWNSFVYHIIISKHTLVLLFIFIDFILVYTIWPF